MERVVQGSYVMKQTKTQTPEILLVREAVLRVGISLCFHGFMADRIQKKIVLCRILHSYLEKQYF